MEFDADFSHQLTFVNKYQKYLMNSYFLYFIVNKTAHVSFSINFYGYVIDDKNLKIKTNENYTLGLFYITCNIDWVNYPYIDRFHFMPLTQYFSFRISSFSHFIQESHQ